MEETLIPLQSVTKVIGLECVDSTLTLAKELALNGEENGTLVLACHQSGSRDRGEKASAEGGVYFTLILRPQKNTASGTLSHQTAEAVAETITDVFGIKTKVKKPNEVLAWNPKSRQWKKMSRVFVEDFSDGDQNQGVLVGVEMHLNNRLPASLKDTAVTVRQLIGYETSKELFLDDLLDNFWKYYAHWLSSVN